MMWILRMAIAVLVVSVVNAQRRNNTGLMKGHHNADIESLGVQMKTSLITKRSYSSQIASTMCHLLPSTCSVLGTFFAVDISEARGPKDLIAIVSTMLATLLGAILVKLSVLIALSVISIAIGKLLLIVLTMKTHLFGHKMPPHPIIYEKVYYPRGNTHRDWQPQGVQPNFDEHSPHEQTIYEYQR